MSYESFVGRRYLMAKQRSRVVSIITLIAVSGVALGVTALIVVLSVMGGFRADLTSKILGAKAHVVIQQPDFGPLDDANAVADRALEVEGVVGASPFIESEVMVSSPTNLSGVVLRGIDVDRVGTVTDLLENLEKGELSNLRDSRGMMERIEEERDEELEVLLDRLDKESKELRETIDAKRGATGVSDDFMPAPDEDLPPLIDLDEVSDETPQPQAERGGDEGFMPPLFDDSGAEAWDLPALPGEEGDEAGGEMPGIVDEAPQDDGRLPGLIIGTELATSLQVRLGDEVNVVTPRGEMGPSGPIPRSRPFRIVGVFYSGMYEYDANAAFTSLDDAARLLDFEGATGVELRTDNVEEVLAVGERLREIFSPELRVMDWQQMNSSLFFALKLEKIAMFLVLIFIILVASFSIVAMLIMIVIEKAREIAILKSMGASDGGIMRVFMFQGVVIGAVGAAAGLGMGLLICYLLQTVGLPLDSEVYYISTLPVEVDRLEVVAVVLSTILISFLATLYPSYQAAKMRPVEGLRYD
ncbi:FtsX-like permease family protein [Lujinxingia vulgaris]|uniref:FtsX-like permease family protein n=1 Tax=Lujinxingia vulgaris TaxID=2600176 RepID=A0A5C6X7L0_9DELT|nr:FtsX-like permease family protein [Lujinxingia vulgaris]TXD37833.1 FtsX-like permease family protein [Lujinxingia vulgaris]